MTSSMVARDLKTVTILDVDVMAEPLDTVLDAIVSRVGDRDRQGTYVCPTGVHGLIEAHKSPAFRELLNQSGFVLPDGMPLVRVARLRGAGETQRAFGPSVMLQVLERTASLPVRHFFYGGKPGVAEELARRMKARFAELDVAGAWCPPFRELTEAEEDRVVEMIRQADPDVIWIGLSTPKQERWAARLHERMPAPMLFTVGAAFDYHVDALRTAPGWMQSMCLEWAFRLGQEPARLWRRYLEIVPRFLVLIVLDQVRWFRRH